MARPLVLLHGFTQTGASWEPVAAALGERYLPIAPDIRGHGAASEKLPVALEPVLSDLAGARPGRFTLAGYSMGGRIALHAALALPDRVEGLVLIGASPGIAEHGEREARRAADERLADEIERASIEEFAARWALNPVLAGQPASIVQAVHADRLRNTPAGLARALRSLGTGALPSLWERLAELRMPVAMVAGERDAKFVEIAQQMAALIPGASVAIVPGAGHAAHLEAPEAVAELIARLR
jgi:2-succinyl-6-hydroxy-2,4-cyclohexadiene-1-carboxylate synthase